MKFHPAMLIPGAVGLLILAGGALLYMTMPEKASIIRVEGDRHGTRMQLRVISLDPEKPLDWRTAAGGSGRGRQKMQLNSYDADHLLILCRDEGDQEVVEHERRLTPGPSRLVTITVHGCRAIEVRSSPLPAF